MDWTRDYEQFNLYAGSLDAIPGGPLTAGSDVIQRQPTPVTSVQICYFSYPYDQRWSNIESFC